ncbi:MAG: 1-deoxy-D-xylulose-5-phosphate synthase [Candidatus Krumholzibacteriia bacterium]
MAKFLDHIDSPADLKKLPAGQLPVLADELRREIIRVIARNGGHLGASLGTVELTVALHYVFDAPRDRIVWDVGHQAHGHKILTDRREVFHTIRTKDGISGFPSRSESEYDTFGVGHASTAISAALGMAVARDLARKRHHVVAVVGDGALTGGIAFEGINNTGILGSDMLVILNDNKMSIAKNVGALSSYLTRVTSGKVYNRFEADVWELLGLIPKLGGKTRRLARRIKESIKNLIVPGIIFEELGFRYFGPVDGHNVEFLVKTLRDLKHIRGPVLLHVITEKGKGVERVDKDSQRFHAVSSFGKVPGDRPKNTGGPPAYTSIVGKTIVELGHDNKKIVAITAAMPDGTGLAAFAAEFPKRFFDVGIAEQHAITFSGGLSTEGYIPVAAIYSTFLQRAYDQIIHDVGIQRLPVRFIMDRAGVVGEDGPTHHGVFDISYLRCVPNFVLMAPRDENELRHMMRTMIDYGEGPIALRIPRGSGVGVQMDAEMKSLSIGKAEVLREGKDVLFLAYGTCVYPALEAASLLDRHRVHSTVVNARFAKPIDTDLIDVLLQSEPLVITAEENVLSGGFGSGVLQHLSEIGYDTGRVKMLGVPDRFIEHAPRGDLLVECGLTAENFAQTALDMLQTGKRVFDSVKDKSA